MVNGPVGVAPGPDADDSASASDSAVLVSVAWLGFRRPGSWSTLSSSGRRLVVSSSSCRRFVVVNLSLIVPWNLPRNLPQEFGCQILLALLPPLDRTLTFFTNVLLRLPYYMVARQLG